MHPAKVCYDMWEPKHSFFVTPWKVAQKAVPEFRIWSIKPIQAQPFSDSILGIHESMPFSSCRLCACLSDFQEVVPLTSISLPEKSYFVSHPTGVTFFRGHFFQRDVESRKIACSLSASGAQFWKARRIAKKNVTPIGLQKWGAAFSSSSFCTKKTLVRRA